jgi:hypothetical protein
MLKRYQILLPEWQANHYKLVSRKYDVSFSEMVRMALCIDIIAATHANLPKYKIDIDENRLKKMMKKRELVGAVQIEEFHSFLSKLYFETRKAAECWVEQENKIKKKK